MIETTNKIVKIESPNDDERQHFNLSSAYGRDALASRIEADIDTYCQGAYQDAEPRRHLGASIIGHECDRYIWFGFRWMFYEKYSGRMLRLFNRGHLEEERVIEWLKGIGIEISQVNLEGKQHHIIASGGHVGGSTDGIGIKFPDRYGKNFPPILLEIKTQKDKKFNILQGSGVIKEKPQHYVQMCVYGYKLGIQYALYIAVNKEDDDLNIEIVELDWTLAHNYLERADSIVKAQEPPKRISDNPSFWICKYCSALAVCHHEASALRNCRSCRFAQPADNKEWFCNRWNNVIPKEFIPVGCSKYESLPTK